MLETIPIASDPRTVHVCDDATLSLDAIQDACGGDIRVSASSGNFFDGVFVAYTM